MEYNIRAIIEVLGKPQAHVEEVIKNVVDNLKKEEGMTTINSHIAPAQKAKEEIYSTFAEVELKVVNFNRLIHFCFYYLPSSVEILDVDEIKLSAQEFTSGMNDILARMHKYNVLTTNLHAENARLKGNIQ